MRNWVAKYVSKDRKRQFTKSFLAFDLDTAQFIAKKKCPKDCVVVFIEEDV